MVMVTSIYFDRPDRDSKRSGKREGSNSPHLWWTKPRKNSLSRLCLSCPPKNSYLMLRDSVMIWWTSVTNVWKVCLLSKWSTRSNHVWFGSQPIKVTKRQKVAHSIHPIARSLASVCTSVSLAVFCIFVYNYTMREQWASSPVQSSFVLDPTSTYCANAHRAVSGMCHSFYFCLSG